MSARERFGSVYGAGFYSVAHHMKYGPPHVDSLQSQALRVLNDLDELERIVGALEGELADEHAGCLPGCTIVRLLAEARNVFSTDRKINPFVPQGDLFDGMAS